MVWSRYRPVGSLSHGRLPHEDAGPNRAANRRLRYDQVFAAESKPCGLIGCKEEQSTLGVWGTRGRTQGERTDEQGQAECRDP